MIANWCRRRRNGLIRLVLLCISGGGLALASWFMDRASLQVQLSSYISSYGFFSNAAPVVILFMLLLCLLNRLALAWLLTFLVTGAVYAANHLKLVYLHTPLSFSDIYLLGNLHVATLQLLLNYVSGHSLLTALLAMVVLVAVLYWKEPHFFGHWSISRGAAGLVTILCVVSLAIGARWVGNFYDPARIRVVAWAPMLTILHSGLISSVVATSIERAHALDMPIDDQAVANLLVLGAESASPVPAVHVDMPDIVMIQSESFFDPAIRSDVEVTAKALPNLHRALKAGVGGTMDVPTYGGGTLRTEFEVLTGIPMAAYPQIDFPYLQITRKIIPSMVHVLRDAGYSTVAIHGNSANFWNRGKAFQSIGFDHFDSAESFSAGATRDGWFFADSAMTDQIISKLDGAKKPTMIFAISIEGHGPYDEVPVADSVRRNSITAPVELTGVGLLEYRNYMYHIEAADQQLGRVWDYLAARGHPYVLVFYGDHLPAFKHTPKIVGYDNGKSGPDQFVPWFIVSSRALPRRSSHIRAWMLGGEVFAAAGVPLPPYYQSIAKAERELARAGSSTYHDAILRGVNSLARLYLTGKLNERLARKRELVTRDATAGGDVR